LVAHLSPPVVMTQKKAIGCCTTIFSPVSVIIWRPERVSIRPGNKLVFPIKSATNGVGVARKFVEANLLNFALIHHRNPIPTKRLPLIVRYQEIIPGLYANLIAAFPYAALNRVRPGVHRVKQLGDSPALAPMPPLLLPTGQMGWKA